MTGVQTCALPISVYEAQQQALLSGYSAESASPTLSETKKSNSSFLDPAKNFRILVKLGVFVVVVLVGIWFIYHLSGKDGKDSISQFVSQTGVGTQVIPWRDRADTAARKLIELNKEQIASAIQGITHPTGKEPALSEYTVSKLADRILVNLKVDWKGGIVGTSYVTSVAWEIGEMGHIEAKVTLDSALTAIDPKNKEMLNDYFRTKVYPTFFSDMGG